MLVNTYQWWNQKIGSKAAILGSLMWPPRPTYPCTALWMSSRLPQPVHGLLFSAHLLWDIAANSGYERRIQRVLSVRFLPLDRQPPATDPSLFSKNSFRYAITAVSGPVSASLGLRSVALTFLNYLKVRISFSNYDGAFHKVRLAIGDLLCKTYSFKGHSKYLSSRTVTIVAYRTLNWRKTYFVDVRIALSYFAKLITSKRVRF